MALGHRRGTRAGPLSDPQADPANGSRFGSKPRGNLFFRGPSRPLAVEMSRVQDVVAQLSKKLLAMRGGSRSAACRARLSAPLRRVQLVVTPLVPGVAAYHSSVLIDSTEYTFSARGVTKACESPSGVSSRRSSVEIDAGFAYVLRESKGALGSARSETGAPGSRIRTREHRGSLRGRFRGPRGDPDDRLGARKAGSRSKFGAKLCFVQSRFKCVIQHGVARRDAFTRCGLGDLSSPILTGWPPSPLVRRHDPPLHV